MFNYHFSFSCFPVCNDAVPMTYVFPLSTLGSLALAKRSEYVTDAACALSELHTRAHWVAPDEPARRAQRAWRHPWRASAASKRPFSPSACRGLWALCSALLTFHLCRGPWALCSALLTSHLPPLPRTSGAVFDPSHLPPAADCALFVPYFPIVILIGNV